MKSSTWNERIRSLPGAHFLQTKEWAEVKQSVGWTREEYSWCDDDGKVVAAAQMLVRSMRLFRFGPRVSVGYIPRGPLVHWEDPAVRERVLGELEKIARQKRLIFLKIDPEVVVGTGVQAESPENEGDSNGELATELGNRGWKFSPEQIQFRNTMMLDLDGSEETWLARMKQKTRYNIRLAQKSGVVVRKVVIEDLPMLYKMYAETANRDGFIIRPESYYLNVWSRFIRADMAEGLVAEHEGIPLAGLVFFYFGVRAWYVYGMSTSLHREKMPNYPLQWQAMCSARDKGCKVYDLWGAPDSFEKTDPMYGVYRFKEGLGAEVVRTIGAWDYPVHPLLYFTYHQVIPRLLSLTRFFRRRQIQQEVL